MENLPHKNSVSRDNDAVGGDIKTLVAFVISGLSEENTSGRPGASL
jgi:hypothetical protein